MDTALNSLDPRFKPVAMEFLARLAEIRIAVVIVNTRRTAQEQAGAVASGNSKVTHSKHQDGLAMDVCPYIIYGLHQDDKLLWDTHDIVWIKIGEVAEKLGLRWGGRFEPLNGIHVGWDPGHVEYLGQVHVAGTTV